MAVQSVARYAIRHLWLSAVAQPDSFGQGQSANYLVGQLGGIGYHPLYDLCAIYMAELCTTSIVGEREQDSWKKQMLIALAPARPIMTS